MDSKRIGEFLKALRKAKGKTQEEVAADFSISPKSVSKWETGTTIPDVSILPALADYYDVTVDEILRGEKKSAGKPNSEETERAVNASQADYLYQRAKKMRDIFFLSGYGALSLAWFLFLVIAYAAEWAAIGCFVGTFVMVGAVIMVVIGLHFDKENRPTLPRPEDQERIKRSSFRYEYWLFGTCLVSFVAFVAWASLAPKGTWLSGYGFTQIVFPILIIGGSLLALLYWIVYARIRNGKRCGASSFERALSYFDRFRFLDWLAFLIFLILFFSSPIISGDTATYPLAVYSGARRANAWIALPACFFCAAIVLYVFGILKKLFPRWTFVSALAAFVASLPLTLEAIEPKSNDYRFDYSSVNNVCTAFLIVYFVLFGLTLAYWIVCLTRSKKKAKEEASSLAEKNGGFSPKE